MIRSKIHNGNKSEYTHDPLKLHWLNALIRWEIRTEWYRFKYISQLEKVKTPPSDSTGNGVFIIMNLIYGLRSEIGRNMI